MGNRNGWFHMSCWNGLSEEQQRRLIEVGNLPIGYRAEGPCPNGARVAIELPDDKAPGPRFYCCDCAIAVLIRFRDIARWIGLPEKATSITCPRCGATSYHPEDIRTGYCGQCHWWTSDPQLGAPEVIARAEVEGAIS